MDGITRPDTQQLCNLALLTKTEMNLDPYLLAESANKGFKPLLAHCR